MAGASKRVGSRPDVTMGPKIEQVAWRPEVQKSIPDCHKYMTLSGRGRFIRILFLFSFWIHVGPCWGPCLVDSEAFLFHSALSWERSREANRFIVLAPRMSPKARSIKVRFSFGSFWEGVVVKVGSCKDGSAELPKG